MDKYFKQAAESVPAGYVHIVRGPIRDDDLVYSWTSNEWLRHDDPSWLHRCEWVSDAVYVVRHIDKVTPIDRPKNKMTYEVEKTVHQSWEQQGILF